MVKLLERELGVYEKNKDELLKKANGKFVLIKDDKIIDIFDTEMDAIRQGYKNFGNVPFLVKQILEIEVPLRFTSNILGI